MSFVGMLYIYMPHFAVQPLVYPVVTSVHSSVLWWLYIHISAWGFGVARFDYDGQFSGASNREASDSAGLHAFFMSSAYL